VWRRAALAALAAAFAAAWNAALRLQRNGGSTTFAP
jgi:hypothetical protein